MSKGSHQLINGPWKVGLEVRVDIAPVPNLMCWLTIIYFEVVQIPLFDVFYIDWLLFFWDQKVLTPCEL